MTPSLPSTPASKSSFSAPSQSLREGRVGRACNAVVLISLLTFIVGFCMGRLFNDPLSPSLPASLQMDEPLTFFTIMYDQNPENQTENWRKNPSKTVIENNDALLRDAGYGLTVFSNDPSISDWNVSNYSYIEDMGVFCPLEAPLCPKLHFFTTPNLWSVGTKAAVHLDADAAILDPAFIEYMTSYTRLPVDFVASPGHERWKGGATFPPEWPFNTGLYYIRLAAFDVPQFRRHLEEGLKRLVGNFAEADEAEKTTRANRKAFGEQIMFNGYLREHSELRVEYLPWRMHCRWKYVRDDCWLVHGWGAHQYVTGLKSLPTDFAPFEDSDSESTTNVDDAVSH